LNEQEAPEAVAAAAAVDDGVEVLRTEVSSKLQQQIADAAGYVVVVVAAAAAVVRHCYCMSSRMEHYKTSEQLSYQ
jgi:hypothetical protein